MDTMVAVVEAKEVETVVGAMEVGMLVVVVAAASKEDMVVVTVAMYQGKVGMVVDMVITTATVVDMAMGMFKVKVQDTAVDTTDILIVAILEVGITSGGGGGGGGGGVGYNCWH